jgi:hypothetical protein
MAQHTQVEHRARLEEFFNRYAAATLAGDVETIANSYFDTYIEASPTEASAYKVDVGYRKALAEKSATMKKIGLAKLDIELQSSREFAPSHYMVRAQCRMQFQPAGKKPVISTFLISYMVRIATDQPKILAYVSHEDEQAVMRRDGLL